jgi:hypothetical protein
MGLIARWYSRRIVNINVNIVLAGLIALGPTAGVAHLTHYVGIQDAWAITAITLLADGIFDVMAYYVLHWLANRSPSKKPGRAGIDLEFIRDASLVQFERALLIPVFYGVTAGLSWYLISSKIAGRELGTVLALLAGIAVTRVVHTIWMIHQERSNAKKAMAAGASNPQVAAPSTLERSDAVGVPANPKPPVREPAEFR